MSSMFTSHIVHSLLDFFEKRSSSKLTVHHVVLVSSSKEVLPFGQPIKPFDS
jgi:hypothetical protein